MVSSFGRIYYFWDNDKYIRGCILKYLATNLGYKIILPNPPNGKLPPSGDKKFRVYEVNRSSCMEKLEEIDKDFGVNSRATGNFDGVLQRGNEYLVIKVKSTIIPRILYETHKDFNMLNLFLGYHLFDPLIAAMYWKFLKKTHKLERYLDNPASIAELFRALIAWTMKGYSQIRPGVMILSCNKKIVDLVIRNLSRLYSYVIRIEKCLLRRHLEISFMTPLVMCVEPAENYDFHNNSPPDLIKYRIYDITIKDPIGNGILETYGIYHYVVWHMDVADANTTNCVGNLCTKSYDQLSRRCILCIMA